jgi:hypothetical protein
MLIDKQALACSCRPCNHPLLEPQNEKSTSTNTNAKAGETEKRSRAKARRPFERRAKRLCPACWGREVGEGRVALRCGYFGW